MKDRKGIVIVLLILFCISICGCGSDGSNQPQVISITEKEAGNTVLLHKNQLLTVSLPGNGSTGYIWDVVSGGESIITQEGSTKFMADSNAVGAGGTYILAFRPVGVGTVPLPLIYHRPAAPNAPPAQSFAVTVSVVD